MHLIITEKPSVSRQVKDVIAPDANYVHVGNLGYYEDDQYLICNTVGHIVEEYRPQEIDQSFTWDLNAVPYNFPDNLPLKVSEDKKDIFNTIKTCFGKYNYDKIYVCTDPDREGENIWRKINKMLPAYSYHQILRVWIHEWTPEGLREAFETAFPDSQKDGLAEAAKCREESDYIIGMNCTVALTKKYAQGYGNVVSIGRVMGPTMHIVYERENEIKNFKPVPFVACSIKTSTDEATSLQLPLKTSENLSKEQADKVKTSVMRDPFITLKKTMKVVQRRCPELYDATTIAQDMNKRFGLSAKQTSDIIQRLYQEYALTTYPGTNARKISVGSAGMAWKILQNLPVHRDICEKIRKNGWQPAPHVVTDEGLAHEAITPVYGSVKQENLAKLTPNERKVYEAICERYLACFFPKAEIEETVITGEKSKYTFETKGKTIREKGWMELLGGGKDTFLPMITDGKTYSIQEFVQEDKETKAPPRYTEESLLSAMKNAGKFVEDEEEAKLLNSKEVEGLGTGRTRPAILENIKNKGYFEVKKKTIYPTQKCMDLFEVLPDTTLSSPSLTAKFEQMIQKVEDGEMTGAEYRSYIDQNVKEIIDAVKSDDRGLKIGGVSEKDGLVCPVCGAAIHETDKAYGCSDWRNGCKFTIWKTVAGKKLTKAQVKALVQKRKTGLIKGFKSTKTGKTFDAYLILDSNNQVKFEFKKNNYGNAKSGAKSSAKTSPTTAYNNYSNTQNKNRTNPASSGGFTLKF